MCKAAHKLLTAAHAVLHLVHALLQPLRHRIKALRKLPELVTALYPAAALEVALRYLFRCGGQGLERSGQHIRQEVRKDASDKQRRRKDLGIACVLRITKLVRSRNVPVRNDTERVPLGLHIAAQPVIALPVVGFQNAYALLCTVRVPLRLAAVGVDELPSGVQLHRLKFRVFGVAHRRKDV